MKYMLLIYQNPATWETFSEEERNRIMNEAGEIMEELTQSGEWIGGEGLADPSNTKTVRVRDRVPAVTDGPFVEIQGAAGRLLHRRMRRRRAGRRRSPPAGPTRGTGRWRCGRSWSRAARRCERGAGLDASRTCCASSRRRCSARSSGATGTSTRARTRCRRRCSRPRSSGRDQGVPRESARLAGRRSRPGGSPTSSAATRARRRREDTTAALAPDAADPDAEASRPGRHADAAVPVLPPGALAAVAGRAHAAGRRRPDHRGDRPRVPRPRGDDGAAHQPGEAADQGDRQPVRAAAGGRAGRAAGRRAARAVPHLQRGLHGHVGPATCTAPTSPARRSGSTRVVHRLLPDDGEVAGLLALMLLTDARRPARTRADGALVPLAEQDRTRWDQARSTRASPSSTDALATRAGRPVPAPGRDRRRPRRGADRGRHRLARRSSRSTTCSSAWRRTRWSRSTAPSRSRWCTAREAGLDLLATLDGDDRMAAPPPPRTPCAPTCWRWPATRRRRGRATRRPPAGPRACPSSATSSHAPPGCATTDRFHAGAAALPTAPAKPELATATGEIVEWRLELVQVPVSDVDRAKSVLHRQSRLQCRPRPPGERRDALRAADATRSPTSIAIGAGITDMAPGSLQGLQMVVADIDAARAELVARTSTSATSSTSMGIVRLLQRSRRERLGRASDPARLAARGRRALAQGGP